MRPDRQADYLKAKFGVLPPFFSFLIGCTACGWGWWRLRYCPYGNWGDLLAGSCALLFGWAIASIGGVVFLIVVTK